MPQVDSLGDDRRPVADEVGDLLDRHVAVAHDRDEGVAQFSRCPVLPMPTALVIERKARWTLPAASGLPFLVWNTRS